MLTILLATRNRAQLLRNFLEAYCHLQPPSSGWKLVIVDNGSTDHTAQVIAEFTNRLSMQSTFEPKVGKNVALNTGLQLVEGDLTVFADDDAFPHADWLVQLRKAADTHPAYSMFGGVIVPRWEVPPPPWIQWIDPGPVYTVTDPSLKEGPIPPFLVFGPNMAIRSGVFQSGIHFDPSMGPKGSSYPMGGETEILMRLGRQGQQAWHVQGAVVEHFIREEQLTQEWVRQRAINFGRGQYRLSPAEERKALKVWMGVPRYLFRRMLEQLEIMGAAWISSRDEELLRSQWCFNFLRGQAIEARVLARRARGTSEDPE
jgi:hypothetical protein